MKRILLVDDERPIREMYRLLLCSEGYQVYEASSAEEATEFLLGHDVHLVILDINMPQVAGPQMKEVIDEYDRDLKVMVASVYPLERQKKIVANADDYYDKAQSPELFLKKVQRLLGESN